MSVLTDNELREQIDTVLGVMKQEIEEQWAVHNSGSFDAIDSEFYAADELIRICRQQQKAAVQEAKLKQTRRIRRHFISVWGRTLDLGFFKEEEKLLKYHPTKQEKGRIMKDKIEPETIDDIIKSMEGETVQHGEPKALIWRLTSKRCQP